MSNTKLNQRDVTRNQSALDIIQDNIFTGNNYYQTAAAMVNTSGAAITPVSGMLVTSLNAGAGNKVAAYETGEDADAIVGVLIVDGVEAAEVADAAELANVNYAISGNVNELKLVSSDGTAIDPDAFVGATTKTLRQALQKLGFHLTPVTDNTKLDN